MVSAEENFAVVSERALPSRRRKRSDPGKPIRVSTVVFNELDKSRGELSWDFFFRRMLGLPTRKGKEQPLIEGVLEAHSGLLILRVSGMSWRNVEELAKKIASKHSKPQPPVRMREIR